MSHDKTFHSGVAPEGAPDRPWLWLRYRHAVWASFFLWFVVLHRQPGADEAVVKPFLAILGFFLLQEWLIAKYQAAGKKASVALALLVLIYNAGATLVAVAPGIAARLPFASA